MMISYIEKISKNDKNATDPSENQEYAFLTQLSESQKLKMEMIEGIRYASDRKTKSKLIKEAVKKLEKSTRTIRRMVSKVEQEGLSGRW